MRVCFLGESFVNGTGDPECLGWTGRICRSRCQKGSDLTYYNLGIRRETSTALRNRWWQEAVLRLPADSDGRLVFSFGTNDTTIENGKRRVELATSLDNLRSILETAKSQFPVLMVGPPAIADAAQTTRIEELSEQFAIVCQELAVPYLETVAVLKRSHVWMQEVMDHDGAHPRAAGYEQLAKLIENWIAWRAWF